MTNEYDISCEIGNVKLKSVKNEDILPFIYLCIRNDSQIIDKYADINIPQIIVVQLFVCLRFAVFGEVVHNDASLHRFAELLRHVLDFFCDSVEI